MKRSSPIALSVVALFLSTTDAWTQNTLTGQTRPRTVTQVAKQTPQTPNAPVAAPSLRAEVTPNNNTTTESAITENSKRNTTQLTPSVIQSRVKEAHRLLKSRPVATAMSPSID